MSDQWPHARQCAERHRLRASPADLIHSTAERIHECCGHGRLKAFRLACGWTVLEAIRELEEACAGRPERGISERSWRKWEAGALPDADYQDRLSLLFSANPVLLGFAPDYSSNATTPGGDPTNRRDALRLAAAAIITPAITGALNEESEARELTRRSEETDLGEVTFDQLGERISDYSGNYARLPAGELWERALADRRTVARLLERRTTLRQRRELYVSAAWLSAILAWAAHDRGGQRTAVAYAVDAWRHADEADHPEAAAWAKDVQATIYLYDDRPDDALAAALAGAAKAPAHTTATSRLDAQVARINARLGRRDDFAARLPQLRGHLDNLPAHVAGLFATDAAHIRSCTATSSLWLDQPDTARAYAEQAVELYESAPPGTAPSRYAIARLDLGIAHARLGDADRAVALGCEALDTPRLAAAILERGNDLDRALRRHASGSDTAREFHELLVGARA